MKRCCFILLCLAFTLNALSQNSILKPDTSGCKLKQMYSALHVEKFWLAGTHVNWLTGEADMPEATTESTTHCSAFVAAACAKANLYIIRPPEHPQELLANAQINWLKSENGRKSGWKEIKTNVFEKAQNAANKGYVVIIAYKNPNPNRPGHIVCVVPDSISTDSLKQLGPTVTEASRQNYSHICFKLAFKNVLKKWPDISAISFFYNIKKPY